MTLTKNMNTQFLTSTAMMTAVLCIVGPLSVPIGPVPVSLTNLAIYLLIYTLDAKRSTIACLLYMLIGLAGANFSGRQEVTSSATFPWRFSQDWQSSAITRTECCAFLQWKLPPGSFTFSAARGSLIRRI